MRPNENISRYGHPHFTAALYEELRTLAARRMAAERPDHTLDPTALVHEAWLRMRDVDPNEGCGLRRFHALAAKVLRNVLVDHARKRRAQKRGGQARREELDELRVASADVKGSVMDLEEAMAKLTSRNERHARIVELRFFANLSTAEIAEELGVSEDTVERDWRMARAWLNRELDRGGGEA